MHQALCLLGSNRDSLTPFSALVMLKLGCCEIEKQCRVLVTQNSDHSYWYLRAEDVRPHGEIWLLKQCVSHVKKQDKAAAG